MRRTDVGHQADSPTQIPVLGWRQVLQRAGAAIADQGKGHRLIVGIDDAHLLDELSVTLDELKNNQNKRGDIFVYLIVKKIHSTHPR